MEYFENESFVLNDLLNRIGERLQLDDTRREKANTSYAAVTEFLKNSDSIFGQKNIEVYSQGSFAIQTTVKPIARDEYDLDFVLEVMLDWKNISQPTLLLDELYKVLKTSDRYSGSCEKKNRCVRLNYAGQFHMDILPACPNRDLGGTNIKIPNRTTKSWSDSNPKGFADWFETKAATRIILEKAARVEPIPNDLPYKFKPPLKRAIQLLKRHRDVYFQENEGYLPRSIVLTTLAGMYYFEDTNLYSTISNILRTVNELLSQTSGVIKLPNPSTNSKENLADDWNDNTEAYRQFKAFMAEFNVEWYNLAHERDNISIHLEKMFGERIAKQVFAEQKDFLDVMKAKSIHSVSPTIIINNPPRSWKRK